MTTQLAPTPVFKGFDNNGAPLALGLLYSYAAGTTTPQATYTDSTGNTPNPNPITLNARGECNLWLNPTQGYKLVLTDSLGNQIWAVDNITGPVNVNQSLVPATDNTFALGSPQSAWAQLYLGPNHVPAFNGPTGNIGYYAITAAEIAAGVTPTNYAYAPGDVRRYGALFNGSTDDTAAINAALSVGGVVRFVPSATAVVNGVLTHNVATTLVDGQGATLNFRSNTNSSVWVITTTDNDPTTQYLVHRAHPMQNMMLLGPAYTANVDCFTATPILNGSTYWMGGLLWDNVGIVGFRNMYTDCAGAIFWEWRGGGGNSDVNYTGGTFLKLVTDGTDNAGENHELNHVIIGDIQGAIWDSVGNANCDIFCTNCSFDGLGYVVTGGSTAGSASAGCALYLDGCHVEAWTAATYIAATSGAFVADGTTFVLSNAITSAPFNSTNSGQGASVSSGVQLLNCRWALGSVGPVYLCDGTGVFVATNNKLLGIYSPGLMSQYNNLINNFIFSGSSPFTSWTTSGTVSASTSNLPTGVVPTPTASMEISGAGSYAEITLPIRQDMLSTLEFYAETTGISTGDSFECALLYLNHSGTQIGSMSFLIANGANVSWGLNSVSIGSAIAGPPQGTTGVTIQFIVNGAGIGYIALPMFAIV